jgi:hypothetical protein
MATVKSALRIKKTSTPVSERASLQRLERRLLAMTRKTIRSLVLVNAVEMAHAHPKTFWRPSKAQLDGIRPNDLVKVCDETERFWVQVTEREGKTILVGRIDNFLFEGKDYGYGDLIRFGVDNVYDVGERVTKS